MLSPNQQLILWFILLILGPLLVGIAYALLRRQLNEMQRAQGGTVVPLWKAALQAAQSFLTHPHPFAQEADELMREAAQELETRIPMPPERYARLEVLLFERISSTDPSIRPGESEMAAAYPYLRRLALFETQEQSFWTKTQTRLVSSQQPADQGDKEKLN